MTFNVGDRVESVLDPNSRYGRVVRVSIGATYPYDVEMDNGGFYLHLPDELTLLEAVADVPDEIADFFVA